MRDIGGPVHIALLLVPFAVLLFSVVVVPVVLTRRRQWSVVSRLLAAAAMVAAAAFVLLSAQEADANPGGGTEGVLGTDVPLLLVPPAVLGLLALAVGRRDARRGPSWGARPG